LPVVSHVVVDDLEGRVRAALAGAVVGERRAGTPVGVAQMLEAAESAAARGGFDADDLAARGLDTLPAGGLAALPLRAIVYGLLTPADRPLLRRSAHRSARLAGGDEGTAMTCVAAAVLAADILRFDFDWCLARLHQTLLEEAPQGLLDRIHPLPDHTALRGDSDPGAALQIAITALHRAGTVAAVLDELDSYGEDLGPAVSLAAALAGARDGSAGATDWAADLPPRVDTTAGLLAARARALWPGPGLPEASRPATIESPGHDQP
jgi:hypothetical protein